MNDQDKDPLLEKAKWVEEQVSKTLDFRIESTDLLRSEAHTTLGWFYAMIVGATGFIVSHPHKDLLFVTIPLGLAVIYTAGEVWVLIRDALLADDYPTPGNVPSNIATPENLSKNEAEMRLSEARGVEECVTKIAAINAKKANAINRARLAIALIPTVTVAVIAVGWSWPS